VTPHRVASVLRLGVLVLLAACGSSAAVKPVADPLGRPYFRDERDGDFLLTRTLAATREPSLLETCADEAYRFVVAHASLETELVVRLERHGERADVASTLYWVDSSWGAFEFTRTRADYAEIYESGQVQGRARTQLSPEAWARLQALIAAADFWHAPDPARLGLDGWSCRVEGRAAGQYRRVERWMPEGAFLDLCKFAMTFHPVPARAQ